MPIVLAQGYELEKYKQNLLLFETEDRGTNFLIAIRSHC